MTRETQDPNLPVSRREMAGMLGMSKETLSYYCRVGTIPPPHRMGRSCYFTAAEAQQIADWWEMRKQLVFKREGELCEDQS